MKLSDINTMNPADEVINEMTSRSGLPREQVESMFRKQALVHGGNLTKVYESMNEMMFADDSFKKTDFYKQVEYLSKALQSDAMKLSPVKYVNELSKLTSLFENAGTMDVLGCVSTLAVLSGHSMTKMFESSGLVTPDAVNFKRLPFVSSNSRNEEIELCKEKSALYSSLANVLSKNNKRWGSNYHLDNAYATIKQYMEQEAESMSLKSNTYSVDDEFHLKLLRKVMRGSGIETMYRHHDVLKTLIPDIQTLVFDCAVLIRTYIDSKKDIMSFMNREVYNEYIDTYEKLVGKLHSSRAASKVCYQDTDMMPVVDFNKVECYIDNVDVRSMNDLIHIMKSCDQAFNTNIAIRKLLNLHVTKAKEVISGAEKTLLEMKKVNKYKGSC
jgi:hypothetical protein